MTIHTLWQKIYGWFNKEPELDARPCESLEDCERLFNALPAEKVRKAISVLKAEIDEKDWQLIANAKCAYGSEWLAHLYDSEADEARKRYGAQFDEMGMGGLYAGMGHFGFGMRVRNLLREKGCGEDYLGIANLDDVYVQLLEAALKWKVTFNLPMPLEVIVEATNQAAATDEALRTDAGVRALGLWSLAQGGRTWHDWPFIGMPTTTVPLYG